MGFTLSRDNGKYLDDNVSQILKMVWECTNVVYVGMYLFDYKSDQGFVKADPVTFF